MKKILIILTLMLTTNLKAGGIPVYDGARHITDIIDNIQDVLDQVNQIKNQVDQIKKLSEQITQMDDYLKRVGQAARVAVKTDQLLNGDIKEILAEIDEYIRGGGMTEEDKEENSELYGEVDKEEHTVINEPAPERKYEKFEQVDKEFAAYKKSSQSINLKRLAILEELESLGRRLDSATTDQEIQKLNASINAHRLMLAALKDEDDRQFQSLQAAVGRNENALSKEITRHQERAKFLDHINRTARKIYRLKRSTEILTKIEGR